MYKNKIISSMKEINNRIAYFTLEPVIENHILTIGNSLRRIMLTSIPGYGIEYVIIKGVNSEFDSIPGIKESILDIFLNLKQIKFKLINLNEIILCINKKTPGDILASDISLNKNDVIIINPKNKIATLAPGYNFEIYFKIIKGIGFLKNQINFEKNLNEKNNKFFLDISFSPIINFNFEYKKINENINLFQIKFTIETDGSILPLDAIKKGIKIFLNYFESLYNIKIK